MIDPGYGYRLIDPRDRLAGDEWWDEKHIRWVPTDMRAIPDIGAAYRRRIEPEFKVGDKVRVVRKDEDWNGWVTSMDQCVGEVGTVKRSPGKYAEPTVTVVGKNWFWDFRPCVLEKVSERGSPDNPATSWQEACEIARERGVKLEPGKWYRLDPLNAAGCLRGRYVGEDKGEPVLALEHENGTGRGYQRLKHAAVLGPWVDEPTDAEIAEAMKWCHKNAAIVAHFGDGDFRVQLVGERFDDAWSPSPRQFVDAVNKYREEHDA